MTHIERLLKIILSAHVSDKTSDNMKRNNTVVLKVLKNSKKYEIKLAIEKFFKVRVYKINTLIVKGKRKRQKNKICKFSNWKKAYVILHTGQNLEFLGHSK
ncbi:50S ribosomal protein L23 [Buchnera aphidicola]|uniref:Large ribosomal subunit protein uL23 n=2 Tax=Buchnera aphidicola (Cinara cedri) TaxID=261318 RepID=Q057A6_BUCCC|nr:50S ribosomal protein L23 [Buchnera aphidicola]AAW72705.1 50S ribosomal protein L23 [Buchnera aphidicola (Cinara cedri)]ABJ90793.1 50S ribosomal protein L23 [Buchnera aphidicola BCc]